MGELIALERLAGTLAERGGDRRSINLVKPEDGPPTLADHGIPYDQAAAFTKLAAVEPERFEKAVEGESTKA